MMRLLSDRSVFLHLAVIAALALLPLVAPDYVRLQATRILVLSVYAVGYNVLYGYAGLLSLGHAMFFAVGLYAAALAVALGGWPAPLAALAGVAAGAVFAAAVGAVALRTTGVAFMVVTLMFAQAVWLTVLYFGDVTRGDEGLVLSPETRAFALFGRTVDLADPATRYGLALGLFAAALAVSLAVVRSPFGRVLVAIRENEARTTMLGYDVTRQKLLAVILSGTLAAAAGAAYALLFGYAGASLAGLQQSINPLLWCLVGGAATTLGPIVGTAFMVTLIDLASGFTTASLMAIGVVLIVTVLFFPKGIMGTIRERALPWLP